ncbi:flagellar FlbD family protein [Sinanaerobacter sp. ZZT-01]|uniref:flagellar FlbD family protein n=1 Tax=Sinanaerobacter sp. ZZT-01 TaxID=3111540 RepID=UPI002D775C17|nr:flagellar FlbD family protein [Sinanaerobacter sp. ZZT-01]WRR93601.1 flagellar FlbD family protein [Sinanaerobacter sp. ZZT-01]
MIKLTKLNNEEFIVNCNQIQMIELIPEAKIVLMNREFFVVRESAEEIIDKIIQYNARIIDTSNITVIKNKE